MQQCKSLIKHKRYIKNKTKIKNLQILTAKENLIKGDKMFKGKIIAITGVTGSWGNCLTKKLLELDVKKIIGISRGEMAQTTMKRKFNNDKIDFRIGDVRDKSRINKLLQGVDIVFHLAALKSVPICEDNMDESIKTNIIGVQNVIDACINNNVFIMCDISTDKSCEPYNFYGSCKSVGEQLVLSANKKSYTKFVCIRAGNVLGSNASVVPFFKELAANKKELLITNEKMSRYFFTVDNAIDLVLEATEKSIGGEIFVTKMNAANLMDLSEVIWNYYNPNDKMQYKIIGDRPGEKLHETLVSQHEAKNTVINDNFRIILPMDKALDDCYENYPKMKEKVFTSDQVVMSKDEIKRLLKKAGCLE